MIWIPDSVRESTSLSAYIKDYLLRMGVRISPHSVDALSESLSAYLEQSSDRAGFFVEDGKLLLLASKALQSVGERKAATRMLLLGSGFARPVSWVVTAHDAGWTLDVSRMTQDHVVGLEMAFFSCLHAALEALAEEWNQANGQVTVVLRGAEEAGRALLGCPVASRRVQAFVDEVELACRQKVAQLAAQYGWQAVPRLLRATAPAAKRD